jgi:alkanesulfonate monooxygenase SsuD/methylene tetrahydromethanopterin reductase-like flavin-dependent oxidoreductase (luciferase family)
MNLGFFTMPIHPLHKDWRLSLKQDREAFLLADELGFTEAYVGEHVTDKAENITSCIAFLAWIAAATKRIRLGTGTINMPNTHPAALAASIAMLDHMLDGRFILGISPGGLLSDAELFGNLEADRNAMFLEAIDQVLEIWAGQPPYNIHGKYWNITTQRTLIEDIGQGIIARPLQRPHPPIVVTAVAPFSKGGHRGRRARLGSDIGQFPDAGLGEEPLASLSRGLRAWRPRGRPRQLARRQERLCRQGRRDGKGLCHRS